MEDKIPLNESPSSGYSDTRRSTKRPHVIINRQTDIPALTSRLFDDWHLSRPDIIVSLIGGTRGYFSAWRCEEHRTALQKGIVKLINATEAWIIDTGLDCGLSKIVGDAVWSEKEIRHLKVQQNTRFQPKVKRHEILLMGMVPLSRVAARDTLSAFKDVAGLKSEYVDPEEQFRTNPHHTHLVLLNEPSADAALLRVNMEYEFARQAEKLKQATIVGTNDDPAEMVKVNEEVPLLAILVQGGPVELDQMLAYVRKEVPVLVVGGSGRLADLIAFAHREYARRQWNIEDVQDIRPDLVRRIERTFPETQTKSEEDRNNILHKLMALMSLSRKDDMNFLTVIDSSDDLVAIDDSILPALFNARSEAANNTLDRIRSDYLLAMKLDKPKTAHSLVLTRDEGRVFQVDHDLFGKSLIWKNREEFVEYAMVNGFSLHKYMNHSRLLWLFRNAEDSEFFNEAVWTRLPRHIFDSQVDEMFLKRDFRPLIARLTGVKNFLSMYELSSNFVGRYIDDEDAADRKAVNALMVWAVMMNRFNLAKTLLKFSEDPVPAALFLSSMYRGLRQTATNEAFDAVLRENSKAFSQIAIDMLDMSYKEASPRTFDLLNQKLPDFNELTPVAIAELSKNRHFISHEVCQTWISQLWDGGIEITRAWIQGIPTEAKILFSALFVFPMLIWIRFPRKNFPEGREDHEDLEKASIKAADDGATVKATLNFNQPFTERYRIDSRDRGDTSGAVDRKLAQLLQYEANHPKGKRLKSFLKRTCRDDGQFSMLYADRDIPLWKRVYYLWSTPRTKFLVHQLFYWIFLAVFSATSMYPTCERSYLDLVVIAWALLIGMEIILRMISELEMGFDVNVRSRVLEIVLIASFVLALSTLKLNYMLFDPFYIRAILTLGLLYAYYRVVLIFFPMSKVLGPMLYRIKKMIMVDFVSFLKLAIPFLLANMFALQAIIYPDMPLDGKSLLTGFHRSFFSVFSDMISAPLTYSAQCEARRIVRTNDTVPNSCWLGEYEDPMCPNLGWTSYAFAIQYLVIVRLILLVLLNALFAATMIKVREEKDYIYNFQRYNTMRDFAARPALPPPLSVLYYISVWSRFVWRKCQDGVNSDQTSILAPRSVKLIEDQTHYAAVGPYSFWKNLTKEYFKQRELKERSQDGPTENTIRVMKILENERMVHALNALRDMVEGKSNGAARQAGRIPVPNETLSGTSAFQEPGDDVIAEPTP